MVHDGAVIEAAAVQYATTPVQLGDPEPHLHKTDETIRQWLREDTVRIYMNV